MRLSTRRISRRRALSIRPWRTPTTSVRVRFNIRTICCAAFRPLSTTRWRGQRGVLMRFYLRCSPAMILFPRTEMNWLEGLCRILRLMTDGQQNKNNNGKQTVRSFPEQVMPDRQSGIFCYTAHLKCPG